MRVAIAYVFWAAAALCLLAIPVTGSRIFYSRTSLPVVEGWKLVAAATALCVIGAIFDLI
jgi:hypothetical protein